MVHKPRQHSSPLPERWEGATGEFEDWEGNTLDQADKGRIVKWEIDPDIREGLLEAAKT